MNERGVLGGIALAAAKHAGSARPTSIDNKAIDDFVTDMDRRLEDEIFKALGAAFPGVPVLGEESLNPSDHLPRDAFLVDPLDGTSNWIAGIPFCGVSIARVVDGETVLAAVADIGRQTCYTAVAGQGAFRDEIPLQLTQPPFQLFTLSTGLLEQTHKAPERFEVLRRYGKVRNLGAQALNLCFAAEGALAFVASAEARLWDDAAGRLVATEAGALYAAGVVATLRGVPAAKQQSLVAHPAIFHEVRDILGGLLNMNEQ